MNYDWEAWKNVKAADRIELHDRVTSKLNWKPEHNPTIDSPHWINFNSHQEIAFLRELACGDSHFCDCCEETRPDVMMYEGADMDDDWEDGIEADIVEAYDFRVCAWCVQDKREETVCETCGVSRWQTYEWIKDEEGEYTKVPRRCTSESGEHSMIHKHPYKEAVQ